jgi:hypothetical protein
MNEKTNLVEDMDMDFMYTIFLNRLKLTRLVQWITF